MIKVWEPTKILIIDKNKWKEVAETDETEIFDHQPYVNSREPRRDDVRAIRNLRVENTRTFFRAKMAYKLTYFDLTGRAEQIRFLLAYLNVDYEDVRLDREQWPSIKPTVPFGKLPVLEIDGKRVNQSMAIGRYLAKKAGLAGDDERHSLSVDAAVDNIYEIRQEIMNNYYEQNEEIKSKTYDVLVNETIPFYLDRFEQIVSDNGGYFVNDKLSWPDLYFVSILDYMRFVTKVDFVHGRPHLTALKHKVLAIPQIESWVAKRPNTQ